MNHAILYGEHELSIDEKNRVLIPIDIRKSLNPDRDGEKFFICIGRNKKPWLYPEKYYEHLVSQRQQELTPDEDALAFDQYHFAMVSLREIDAQGRILLPDKTLKRTGTTREVTLIGARDHLEIWNRSDWENRFAQLTESDPKSPKPTKPAAQPAGTNEV